MEPERKVTRTPEEQELFELYGRVKPFGTLEFGDGSERCLICRTRDRRFSFYVWLPRPYPVCGELHAQALRDQLADTRRAAICPTCGQQRNSTAPARLR